MLEFYLKRETEIEVNGEILEIVNKADFRGILTMLVSLKNYTEQTQSLYALSQFYQLKPMDLTTKYLPFLDTMQRSMDFFLTMGKSNEKGIKVAGASMNWETDIKYIISAIQRTHAIDILELEYLHWWKFLTLLNEVDGNTTLAYIMKIRNKRAKPSKDNKLTADERRFINENPSLFDVKNLWG